VRARLGVPGGRIRPPQAVNNAKLPALNVLVRAKDLPLDAPLGGVKAQAVNSAKRSALNVLARAKDLPLDAPLGGVKARAVGDAKRSALNVLVRAKDLPLDAPLGGVKAQAVNKATLPALSVLARAKDLPLDAPLGGVKAWAVKHAKRPALSVLARAKGLGLGAELPMPKAHVLYLEARQAQAESLAGVLSELTGATRPPNNSQTLQWLAASRPRLQAAVTAALPGQQVSSYRVYLGISWVEDLLRLLPPSASGRLAAVRILLWKLLHHRVGAMPDIFHDGSNAGAFASPGNAHFEFAGPVAVSVAVCLTALDAEGFPQVVRHRSGRYILFTTSAVNLNEGIGASYLNGLARSGAHNIGRPRPPHKLQDEHGGGGTLGVMLQGNAAAKALRELRALPDSAPASVREALARRARAVPAACIMYHAVGPQRGPADLRANYIPYVEYCLPAEDPSLAAVVFDGAGAGPGGRGRGFLQHANFAASLQEMRTNLQQQQQAAAAAAAAAAGGM
jgi:hypothetical protein